MYSRILHVHVHVRAHTHTHTHMFTATLKVQTVTVVEREGGMEGESEEAVRRRIAAEYQNEGLWATTLSGKDNEQGGGGGAAEGDDDDDPLDAFMAGIEVKCMCISVWVWVCVGVCTANIANIGEGSSRVFRVHTEQ